MQSTLGWTADMVRQLPADGRRYEVINGALLVTPSPTDVHQRALLKLVRLLADYVDATGVGETWISPSDVELDAHSMVQPDAYVEGLVDGRFSAGWNSGAPLLLVIEVLSPATARVDRTTKRRRYQQAGIPEYWIVDTDARTIEVWRPEDARPEVLSESLVWRQAPNAEPLVIDLAALFIYAHRESR